MGMVIVRVLIAGGGIGGLALARGLAGSGHSVRVFEQAPALRTGGAAVTIFSNGAAALAGLGAPLAGFGGRLDILRFDSAGGPTTVTADLTVLARRTGFPVTSVPRDRLIEHLAKGVPVEFSREIVDIEVRPDGVIAVDAAGRRHEADVVVGADGHRSAVRRAILDPAPATGNEWTTWQGLTRVLPELAAGAAGVCVVGDAGLVGLLPSGDGLLMWWFDVHQPLEGSPAAGLANYWVIDPLFDDGIVLTEFRHGANGDHELLSSANAVCTTDVPCPVTIDLPALTSQLQALEDPADPDV